MSRRVILLVTLSVAAIFLASFVLLQGRSDFTRPLFPKPWGSSGPSDSGSKSWLKEHLDGITKEHGAPKGDGETKPAKTTHAMTETPSLESVPTKTPGPDAITTWMLEVGGSHDEVIAAFINSFGAQPNVEFELFQRLQRFGIKDIFDQFELTNPLPNFIHKTKFNSTELYVPKIILSLTCELDAMEMDREFTKLAELGQTYLFCVIHHADRWVKNKSQRIVQQWVERGLVDFVTLSKHTQVFLEKELKKWELPEGSAKPSVRHMVPVFPVDLSESKVQPKEDELSFALQGNYDSGRRDYNKIFNHLDGFLKNSTAADVDITDHSAHPDIQLHLLGHGHKPEVPKELEPHVKFDEGLGYLDFYGMISRMFALLPGFANDEYYDRKASSTVPAALIAGTPLVATQQLLDAYTYVPEEAVWLQGPDEEDFKVIERILAMTPEERKKKKEAVKTANLKRVEMNKVLAAEWIREGMAKVRAYQEKKDAPKEPEVMEGVGSSETQSRR